ncbi:hypothetical protein Pmani_015507 [Petrolisthes manimaculis]|uniref:Protein kinase domain-containing protein n=1 Tax=Petrolisthes manimaculis TaxID=1843537 RepID=A0AAE1PS66_9EUCA|nr:hypothetical protein Pmani_015507 [Petrolisthes manimaculis]
MGFKLVDVKPLETQLTFYNLLGEGGYGDVYSVTLEDVPYPLCLKLIRVICALDSTVHEATALAIMRHIRGVPRLVGICLDPPAVLMSMHGRVTLTKFCKVKPVDEYVLLRIFHTLSGILALINRWGFSHNDIKASNVTIENYSEASTTVTTLIDLGLLSNHEVYPFGKASDLNSRELEIQHAKKPWYDPDLFCGRKPTSTGTDMYSFGYMLRSALKLLPKTSSRLRGMTYRALGPLKDRPSFLEARRVIYNAAMRCKAWDSDLSPDDFSHTNEE